MGLLDALKGWGVALLAILAAAATAFGYGKVKSNQAERAEEQSRKLQAELAEQQEQHRQVVDTVQQRQEVDLKAKGESDADADARFDRWSQ